MLFRFSILPVLTLLLVSVAGCGPGSETQKQHPKYHAINRDSLQKTFIKANQQVVQKENDEMDYYAKSHQMPFVKTKAGLQYFVYKPSAKGDSIKDGDQITIDYKVSLLDGTACYSSETDGKKTFIVGQENIESGIHKGVLYLKRGDKALIMIPSHLAHGLLGDFKKIPPQMPIVYDLEVH